MLSESSFTLGQYTFKVYNGTWRKNDPTIAWTRLRQQLAKKSSSSLHPRCSRRQDWALAGRTSMILFKLWKVSTFTSR